jgi:putative transposase
MKLAAKIKLLPSPEQFEALKFTLAAANKACDYISDQAWQTKTFRKYALHHLCYRDIRSRFGLSSQVAVRAIAKVADAYKLDHKVKRTFKPTGSIAFDDRILSWKLLKSSVSIWTTAGRVRIPFICGSKQRELLQNRQGETDISFRKGKFYLSPTCDIDVHNQINQTDVIGYDLGVKNIAVDSDGVVHSSATVNNVRHRHRRLRTKLQTKGTRSAKRKLKKLSGKESRFAKDVNHRISKEIVTKAKGTTCAVALEDLTGLRMRVTVHRSQRATLSSWSFRQLRSFIDYKAARDGIPILLVDAHNTSRTCPACGHIDKQNRKNQRLFSCVVCRFAGLADHIAAINIRRAAINPPIAARDEAKAKPPELRQSVVANPVSLAAG